MKNLILTLSEVVYDNRNKRAEQVGSAPQETWNLKNTTGIQLLFNRCFQIDKTISNTLCPLFQNRNNIFQGNAGVFNGLFFIAF